MKLSLEAVVATVDEIRRKSMNNQMALDMERRLMETVVRSIATGAHSAGEAEALCEALTESFTIQLRR